MGGSMSSAGSSISRCENNPETKDKSKFDASYPGMGADTTEDGPPPMTRPQSIEERAWAKFKSQPLVPIGCMATAYFLASGIKSFQNQDPRRSQKMMRLRVGAQFATLAMFMFYLGPERINFGIAPQYQRAKAARAEYEQQMERERKE